MNEFKRFFLRGLTAVLPTLLTIALIMWAYRLVDTYVGKYITLGMKQLVSLTGAPDESLVDPMKDSLRYGVPIDEWNNDGERLTVEYKIINHKALASSDPAVRQRVAKARNQTLWTIAFAKYKLHVVGFLMAIIVIYSVGIFLASFIGRTIWRAAEQALSRMPLIRAIYPNIKQVTDFLFGDQKYEFSGVVAVQYPRQGIWSLGFLTGSPMEVLSRTTSDELVTIFIPSSPTPMTGYTITVSRKDTVDLAISVDEALRFTISAGVIKPNTRLSAALAEAADEAKDNA